MADDDIEVSPEELKKAIEWYLECEKHDPGGVLRRFLPMYNIEHALRNQRLSEEQYKEKIAAAFVSILQEWENEEPDHLITNDDCFWLVIVATQLGFGEIMGKGLLKWMLEHDPTCVFENLNKMRKEGIIPVGLADIKFLELIFVRPKLKITPGHPYFKSLGVSNSAEWKELKENRIPILAEHIDAHTKVLIRTAQRAYGRQDNEPGRFEHKDEFYHIQHFSELPESELIKLSSEDRQLQYLNDGDRLSQFWELAGVEMSSFTDSESRRILDLFNALDDITGHGYSLGSKKGISLKDYYGDKADSEKTQRQKLFKKIRENSNKTK